MAHPPHPIPCPEQAGDPLDARTLIGLSEADAEALAGRRGCHLRVASRDGTGATLTGDDRPDRVDVYVDDGRIVGVRES